jgi:hypothetical protein
MDESQDSKELLLKAAQELHDLAAQHQQLEARLHELSAKQYLSESEHIEEVTLKKRKLQLKDRMEQIRTRAGRRPISELRNAQAHG